MEEALKNPHYKKKGNRTTHGMSKTRFYKIWNGIKNRCNNTNELNYTRYGGKNIKICEEWNKFENFYNDMYELYVKHNAIYGDKNTTIDRINNNNGYSKLNCRWATLREQANNKASVIQVNNKTLSYWGEDIKLSTGTLRARIRYGWDVNQVITQEKTKYKGYSYDKIRNKWQVEIKRNRKRHFIGRFDTEEEAKNARQVALKSLTQTNP